MLTDRIAVVTGAAQGIGEATALALASLGAHVAICDRQADGLAETADAIDAMGRRVLADVFDVRDAESVELALESCPAPASAPSAMNQQYGTMRHAPIVARSSAAGRDVGSVAKRAEQRAGEADNDDGEHERALADGSE